MVWPGVAAVRWTSQVSWPTKMAIQAAELAKMAAPVVKGRLTVSASIPVAVISITVFRALSKLGFRDATILENNIAQTAGSAGESIAFGVGVTMPAIMILGFSLELTRVALVAVLGGLLGILMMTPLRRALIVEQFQALFLGKQIDGNFCFFGITRVDIERHGLVLCFGLRRDEREALIDFFFQLRIVGPERCPEIFEMRSGGRVAVDAQHKSPLRRVEFQPVE